MMSPEATAPVPQVQVSSRGPVPPAAVEHARRAVDTVARHAPRPVLMARCRLLTDTDPARERPHEARATLDVSGRIVRAHVAAEEMHLAIDRLQARLRRGLDDLAAGRRAERHRTGSPAPGEWRHGDIPADRPSYFPRPVAEREVVRRKAFSLGRMTPDEAAWEMHLADHGFQLFTDDRTGRDAVVHIRGDGGIGLCQVVVDPEAEARASVAITVDRQPAPALDEQGARRVLDAEEVPFVFYTDLVDGRGRVLYRRYDGHYGLIEPAAG